MIADLGIAFGRVAVMMFFVLNTAAILGWVERKQSAIMQDRIGANRASIFGLRALGLFHPLADTLKMLTKEDFRPARADRLLFDLAPFVSVLFALMAFASIPFGDTLRIGDRVIPLQAVTLNVGILYAFAMLSLGVYGVMMAGWSSANNYALLGGQRAAALMISAEIAIGATRSLASGWPELRRPCALPALRRDRMGGAAASYSPAEFAWTPDASFVYTSGIG